MRFTDRMATLDFTSLALHESLNRGIADLGFTRPTPIQQQGIPEALKGRDLLACAATGSGKTAAFLLPIMEQIIERPRGTTRALVMAPTRELALQIVEDAKDLAKHTSIEAAAVFGGVGMIPQEKAIRRGVDILVATPGRLLDHFGRGYASLSGLEFLVLDEADRMMDMGFLPDIRRILRHVPTPRQTLFFSATMPKEIEKLSREILRDPAKIALQRKAAPAAGVAQFAYPVPATLKTDLLVEIFRRDSIYNALVFTRTKHRANRLTKILARNDISAERIHGNRSQAQRTRALAGFKAGDFQVLVATDIAARGIDVTALSHVINFDVPAVAEDYIHRVGRTGRAELTGSALTLVTPDDEFDFKAIERAVGASIERVLLEGFPYDSAPDPPPQQKQGRGNRRRPGSRGGSKKNAGAPSGNDSSKEERKGPRRRRYGKRPG